MVIFHCYVSSPEGIHRLPSGDNTIFFFCDVVELVRIETRADPLRGTRGTLQSNMARMVAPAMNLHSGISQLAMFYCKKLPKIGFHWIKIDSITVGHLQPASPGTLKSMRWLSHHVHSFFLW